MKIVSVHFNTTKHVKSFLANNYGEKPMFDSNNPFHDLLLLSLTHTTTWSYNKCVLYPEDTKIFISKDDYLRYGCYLNKLQNKILHLHIDRTMKLMMVCHANAYLNLSSTKVLKNALEYSLEMMKLTEDDWDMDSVKRYYHRYRVRNGKELLYNKEKPLEKLSDLKKDALPLELAMRKNLEGTLFDQMKI